MTSEHKTVPLRLGTRYAIDGLPQPRTDYMELALPVRDEDLADDGAVRWSVELEVEERVERQEEVTVRFLPARFPIEIAMERDRLRELLISGDTAEGILDLSFRSN